MYEFFYIIFFLVILGAAWYFVIRPSGMKLPGLPRWGRSNPKTGGICPFCSSDDVIYSPKRQLWTCNSCKEVFNKPNKPVSLPKTSALTVGGTDLEELLRYVPDEFVPNATAFLNGSNPDRVWLELFSYKYPKLYRQFINLFMGFTRRVKKS